MNDFRAPPQSVEAEQAVLGALMIAPDSLRRVADLITSADFYRRDHAEIFEAIADLVGKKQPADVITVPQWFVDTGREVDADYIIDLARTTPSSASIRWHAEIIADKARLRRLIDAGTAMVNDGFAPDGRATDELLADAQGALSAIVKSRGHRLKSVDDGLTEMVEGMQRRMDADGLVGTSFGLPSMDDKTGGKQPGDLIIIAARPSMGKTTLALQGCLAAGRPLIFSFETMAEKLLARMAANVGRFPLRWILFPQEAPDFAFGRITEAAREVKKRLSASIYDGRRLSISQLRAIALREHDKSPVREVVIDHFGHLKRDGKGRADLEQGEDMKELKALAREMNVPVIVLMQLNRGVETRADKRPILSDLRECGAAEEDADVVAMLYRDGYYNPNGALKTFGEIFLRKNRDGDPGEIWTHPVLPEMRFDEAEPQTRSDPNAGFAGGHGGGQARSATGLKPRSVSGYREHM